MRVAVIKPEWGIRGGFELVVERLRSHMADHGHEVRVLSFDAWAADRRPFGQRVTEESWLRSPDYFQYISQVEAARNLFTRRADLVISTQPPSFVVDHPRHLALFFHHARPFYDLGPYVLEAGMVNPAYHAEASAAVRAIDAAAFSRVKHIAAGSETVAARLADFNQRVNGASLFHAGPSVERSTVELPDPQGGEHVLCVSRHDFPKRTELFVLAARLAPELRAVSVGTGGRIGFLRQLNDRLATVGHADQDESRSLWCCDPPWVDPNDVVGHRTNVHFAGAVSNAVLDSFYRGASCVVAPALLEDYGLTAIEAMRYGKPMIVCNDGGHLCELVEHGVTGLVVEPTGQAIAEAMRFIVANPEAAADMGANGREVAARFTWSQAFAEFDDAMEATLS